MFSGLAASPSVRVLTDGRPPAAGGAAQPVQPYPADRDHAAGDPAGRAGLRLLRAPLGLGDPLAGVRLRRRGRTPGRAAGGGADARGAGAGARSGAQALRVRGLSASPTALCARRPRSAACRRPRALEQKLEEPFYAALRPAVRDRHPPGRAAAGGSRSTSSSTTACCACWHRASASTATPPASSSAGWSACRCCCSSWRSTS